MGDPGAFDPGTGAASRRQRPATRPRQPIRDERHLMGAANWGSLERSTGSISVFDYLLQTLFSLGRRWRDAKDPGSAGAGSGRARRHRSGGMLYRRHLRSGEKGGSKVGKTKRGKGTKLMVIADANGLPVAVHTASASPHEVTLVEATLDETLTLGRPRRLIGDRAYDSDPLDQRLAQDGIEMISPHRRGRKRPATQDGRKLRCYSRRWKIERTFAWLNKYRRVLTRWDHNHHHFTGFVHLACAMILLRRHLWNEF